MTEYFLDGLVRATTELSGCHTQLLHRQENVEALAQRIGRSDSFAELSTNVRRCATALEQQAAKIKQLQYTLEQIAAEVARTETILTQRAASNAGMTQGWQPPRNVAIQYGELGDIGIIFEESR